jgi:hypothetical protein
MHAVATSEGSAFTSRAWLAVSAFLFLVGFARNLYALSERRLPPLFELLGWLGSGLLFAYLVRRDRAVRGLSAAPADFGGLVLVAWPVVVPYHFFATRGRRGWRPFIMFLVTWFGTEALCVGLFFVARYFIYGG